MNDENDFYCGLNVDAGVAESVLSLELAQTLKVSSDKWNDIETNVGRIYFLENDEFDEQQRQDADNGFLFYRYKLEIQPKPDLGEENAINFVSKVLEHFWSLGHPATAACDYEEKLPRKGKYIPEQHQWN